MGELLTFKEAEERALREALDYTRWNKVWTAKILGCAVRTVYNKVKEHKLKSVIKCKEGN